MRLFQSWWITRQTTAELCSVRAAFSTVIAASAFMAAMPSPTTKSGQADAHRSVINPAAMMARLANASLRADRKAALVKLPL